MTDSSSLASVSTLGPDTAQYEDLDNDDFGTFKVPDMSVRTVDTLLCNFTLKTIAKRPQQSVGRIS